MLANCRFVVSIARHSRPVPFAYTEHRKPKAAARAAAQAIRHLRDLTHCHIVSLEDNRMWPLEGFRAAIKRGDYA